MADRIMRDPRLIYHPAECCKSCDDPQCPYMHCDMWEVDGNLYHDSAQAAAMLPATIVTRGDAS